MNATLDPSGAQDLAEPRDGQDLRGLVIVVAGAAGAAGPPLVERLARAGATVVAAGSNRERIDGVVADVPTRIPSGRVHAAVVDLLDEQATREWADLADWNWLQERLVRTLQHTSRAFHDAIKASPRGRLVAKPEAAFAGHTPVDDLADTIHDLWLTPAVELNGQRL